MPMYSGWYWGNGSSWWMAVMMCVTMTVLVAVVVWAIVRSNRSVGSARLESPREALDLRYARGEIDTADYEERAARLDAGPGPR